MAAMIMLSGWEAGLQHLLSAEKLPFSAGYAGSMVATVYAAVVMNSYLLSIVFSAAQVRACQALRIRQQCLLRDASQSRT